MKYLVFFLILGTINLFSYNGHSTVVYLQSSKTKTLKVSKSKNVKITRKCPLNVNKVKSTAPVQIQ